MNGDTAVGIYCLGCADFSFHGRVNVPGAQSIGIQFVANATCNYLGGYVYVTSLGGVGVEFRDGAVAGNIFGVIQNTNNAVGLKMGGLTASNVNVDVPNLTAGNVKKDTVILGVTGTLEAGGGQHSSVFVG